MAGYRVVFYPESEQENGKAKRNPIEKTIGEIMTNLNKENLSEYAFTDYLKSIDYVASPNEELVLEIINERLLQNLSQKQLATKIGTRQSVISRFENLGRSPSIKWLIQLAKGLGARFRATIHGDYMYVVPRKFRADLDSAAKQEGLPVATYIENILNEYFN